MNDETEETPAPEPPTERAPFCPQCGVKMTRKTGKFGDFWGCPRYPGCRETIRIGNPAAKDRKVNAEELKQANDLMNETMAFINRCGGLQSAWRWLKAAQHVLLATGEIKKKFGKVKNEPSDERPGDP